MCAEWVVTMMTLRRLVLAAVAALPLLQACAPAASEDAAADESAVATEEECPASVCSKTSGPEELTYEELTQLSALDGHREGTRYMLPKASAALSEKVNTLLNTPFVSNEAYFAGARKRAPIDPQLGTPTVRAVAWNIERGQQLPLIIQTLKAADDKTARAAFYANLDPKVKADPAKMTEIETQLDALANTDVFVLNEVDRGMKRSGYADVIGTLGRELKMNYAYGVEFLEVDPIALGSENFEAEDFATYDAESKTTGDDASPAMAAEANAAIKVDRSKIKALHGNAILSRYPIKNAHLEPLQTKQGRKNGSGCWDWNADEKRDLNFADSLLAAGQRFVTEKIFLTKTSRELRHGGRTSLRVDLMVNGLDGKDLTVANAHVEAKGTPECRQSQMKEILAKIEGNKNPVLLAGDLNTTGTDGRPMTVARLLFARFENPEFYLKQITSRLAIPYAGWAWLAWDTFKWFKKLDDPTSLFSPEHHMFNDIKKAGFDFRGEKDRTVKTASKPEGTEKTLANSNERDRKGFKTTFTVGGPLKFKLDWMLVRGFDQLAPKGTPASYRMAPHFPRTLEELNKSVGTEGLSDHAPVTVVMPLGVPKTTLMSTTETGADDYTISDE